MKTIKETFKNELTIKNSKFIAILFPLSNEDKIDEIINNLKSQYKNATHYCYAYIIDNIKHSNDDGEPSGTAGQPILNVLEGNDLNNVLCVVIRYFGGIKLGAGGLIRA
ncbi:MAG: YigZ family protein, partial [Bacilli bacterium]